MNAAPSISALDHPLTPVAHIVSPFKSRFGIPRQSGLVPSAIGWIEPCAPWDRSEAWAGIEEFTHLWLIWLVHDQPHQPVSSVRPPRLGGNVRIGVFASRAPARPNPLGLSLVRLEQVHTINGRVRIEISGLDLLDGTPILDIKPHIGFTDCPEEADSGFARQAPSRLGVDWSALPLDRLAELNENQRAVIGETLSLDPRPAFHDDPERIYGCPLFDWDVRFKVRGGQVAVIDLVAGQSI